MSLSHFVCVCRQLVWSYSVVGILIICVLWSFVRRSIFLVCVPFPSSLESGMKGVCSLNEERNKGKLSICVVKQFLCHRKKKSSKRLLVEIYAICVSFFMWFLNTLPSLCGMMMNNWLCLCFYLWSPTNNAMASESFAEHNWQHLKPEAIRNYPLNFTERWENNYLRRYHWMRYHRSAFPRNIQRSFVDGRIPKFVKVSHRNPGFGLRRFCYYV